MGKVYRSPFWPPLTAHREYWERYNCAQVYAYDPADDGPETELGYITKAILSTHSLEELREERFDFRLFKARTNVHVPLRSGSL